MVSHWVKESESALQDGGDFEKVPWFREMVKWDSPDIAFRRIKDSRRTDVGILPVGIGGTKYSVGRRSGHRRDGQLQV